ncbi:acetyl-CoA synthetase-like protein [Marasmius fiardii PR-910]|nr:acetyl-CoA synthetase-like protein [Marasmius fiardii PR-910]
MAISPIVPIPTPPQTQAVGSATFRPPVLDGSMNLLDMCDWHYENSPNHPTFIFPRKDGTTRTITWHETASAVYRGVKLLRDRFGVEQSVSSEEAPVVAIVSHSVETIGYNTTLLTLMRANLIPFLISTRNALAVVAHLLVAGRVQYVLVSGDEHSQQLLEQAFDILRSSGETLPKVAPMLLFEDLYVGVKDETPLPRTRKNLGDVAIYLQSSMSTGKFPKIIPRNHRKLVENGTVPYYGGKDFSKIVISLHSLPMLYGVATSMLVAMASCGVITACFEPRFPPTIPTPSSVLEASEKTECDIIMTFPSFLEEWSRQPEKLRWLKKRDGHLAFTGSALEKEIGDKLVSEGISVITQYGAADTGTLSSWFPKSTPGEEWEYFQFSGHLKLNLVPHGDDTYEVVMMPSPSYIPLVTNVTIDGVDGYSNSDLVVPHPTKPGFWKLHGRCDDQILHSSGKKTNPGPLEAILRKDPLIRGAVLFGKKDQLQLGAIIDLDVNNPDAVAYLENHRDIIDSDIWDRIWPTIQKMNASAPAQSKLSKDMILFAGPDKPFKYTGKGTARRQIILEEHKDEITKLYERVGSCNGNHSD